MKSGEEDHCFGGSAPCLEPKGMTELSIVSPELQIIQLLELNVPKTKIAERFGTSKVNLHGWLKSRNIKVNNS